MRYFAVKWGENIRISQKCRNVSVACRYCYGMVGESMLYKDLGTTKNGVRKRITKLNTEDAKWKMIPEEFLDRLERLARASRIRAQTNEP